MGVKFNEYKFPVVTSDYKVRESKGESSKKIFPAPFHQRAQACLSTYDVHRVQARRDDNFGKRGSFCWLNVIVSK